MTLDRDLDAAEAAELRLEARSRERREELARRARRRRVCACGSSRRSCCPPSGAAALVVALEREGGDFGGWPAWRVALVLAGAFLLPGAPRGVARAPPRRAGGARVGDRCVCIEVVLVFGVGFLLLDYGPR